ncbi:MAG TPA: hypothetical protein VF444_12850 [Pseudonocardiaceae bacterium]
MVGTADDTARGAVFGSRRDAAATCAVAAVWGIAWVASVHGVYTAWGVVSLCVGVLVLFGALWTGAAYGRASTRLLLLLTVPTGLLSIALAPPLINQVPGLPGLLMAGIVVSGLALLAWPAIPALTRLSPRLTVAGTVGLTAASFVLVILGSKPVIDVWVILRDSARALLHGQNPYALTFPDVPPGQTSSCFNYWPVTFLSTAPGQWLLGDVRYVEAGCVVAASGLLAWQAGKASGWRDRQALGTAVLVGLVPGSLLVVQQAWTEPMLLLGMVGGALLMRRGHYTWAAVPLGLALATKQHLVVLLPLLLFWPRFGWRRLLLTGGVAAAVSAPWALADWSRFRLCTVDFFLGEQGPAQSLSLWRLLPGALQMPVLVLGMAAAVVVVLLRCPRTPGGFLIASGAVLAAFDLLNKQTFTNQWWLAAALALAGMTMTPVTAAVAGSGRVRSAVRVR